MTGVLLDDRYQILALEGQIGGFTVYTARHQLMGKNVRVKVLPPELFKSAEQLDEFRRTAKILCSIDHPAFLAVRDFGVYADIAPYLVVDHFDGKTLAELIKSEGPLPAGQIIKVGAQVCDALEYLQSSGHRAPLLSPQALIVETGDSSYQQIRLSQYESAGHFNGSDTVDLAGSRYLSPEQFIGRLPDERSAVYSLGCILYECLSGEPPFAGDDIDQVAQHHISGESSTFKEPSALAGTSRKLISIVAKAMNKSPKARYQSLKELKAALEELEELAAREKPESTKRTLMLPLTLVIVLLLSCLLIWSFTTPEGKLFASKLSLTIMELASPSGSANTINLRQSLAEQSLAIGDISQARSYYLSLMPLLEQKYGAISEEVADLLSHLGELSLKLGDRQEADRYNITAASRYKDLAISGIRLKDSTRAFRLRSKEASVLAKCQGKKERERSDALYCAASIAEEQQNYSAALKLIQEKIDFDKQCAAAAKSPKLQRKWQEIQAFALTKKASILVKVNQLSPAEGLYLEALELFGESAAPVDKSYAHEGIADLYSMRQQQDEAEQHMKQCLALRHSVLRADDPLIALGEWKIALIYRSKKQYLLALKYMQDFLQHYRIKGGPITAAHQALYEDLQQHVRKLSDQQQPNSRDSRE